jgi:hypothetical protein
VCIYICKELRLAGNPEKFPAGIENGRILARSEEIPFWALWYKACVGSLEPILGKTFWTIERITFVNTLIP